MDYTCSNGGGHTGPGKSLFTCLFEDSNPGPKIHQSGGILPLGFYSTELAEVPTHHRNHFGNSTKVEMFWFLSKVEGLAP